MRTRSITSANPVSEVLKEGYHKVRLISAIDCDSFTDIKTDNTDGRTTLVIAGRKTKQFPWASPTMEIGIHIGNEQGTIVTRLHESSWKKAKDYPDLCQNPAYTEHNGYLCTMINGKLDREPDPRGLEKCARILSGFAYAIVDGQEGVDFNEAIDKAIAGKTEFMIKVTKDPYLDKESGNMVDGYSIDGFWALSKFVAPKTKAVTSNVPADIQA